MATRRRAGERAKKYAPLAAYLKSLKRSITEIILSFTEVERIIGDTLPPTAFNHRQWWENQDSGSHAPLWMEAGFKTGPVDMKRRTVRFYRDGAPPPSPPRALSLQQVITELNEAVRDRPIGGLQEWRKENKGLTRTGTSALFYSGVAEDRDYAFHAGGQDELQFNVGFEDVGTYTFRHGVAFSLQPTREHPDIEPMLPKIERFNEYLHVHPEDFEGFSMWHYQGGRRSSYGVSPIPDDLCRRDTFIFLGALQPADQISIDWILDDFDRLLPLYEYVEGSGRFPKIVPERKGFVWTPGNKARVTHTRFERKARSVDKTLRHNMIQPALFDYLQAIHGEANVSGEQGSGNGTQIDVAVREGDEFTYYEIKTGLSAQSCIREALGQLLEYSHWPGCQKAGRMVVVGEAAYDADAKAYIKRLREDFSLPIEYQQFDLKSRRLITKG